MQRTSWETLNWIKHKLESRLQGEISTTSDMKMTPPSWQNAEDLKSLLMKGEKGSEKVGLKLNIQKAKIMASSPITSWKIDEKQWKQWQTLFSWAPKIPANGDCSHEIKRCFLLGRKAVTNLDSILKSRDITLSTKVCIVKAMVFPVVIYGCEKESWALKNW